MPVVNIATPTQKAREYVEWSFVKFQAVPEVESTSTAAGEKSSDHINHAVDHHSDSDFGLQNHVWLMGRLCAQGQSKLFFITELSIEDLRKLTELFLESLDANKFVKRILNLGHITDQRQRNVLLVSHRHSPLTISRRTVRSILHRFKQKRGMGETCKLYEVDCLISTPVRSSVRMC